MPPRSKKPAAKKTPAKPAAKVAAKPAVRAVAKAPAKVAPKAPVPVPKPKRGALPFPVRDTMNISWPLFGELARALALKVSRDFDPDLVVGVATAGVVPGAVVAAMLDRPFHSIIVSRRYRADAVRETPSVLSAAPGDVLKKRVLIVDETCNNGDTMRLAKAAIVNAGATEVRTAVSFKTGPYQPDWYALETESMIVLPWDKETIVDGELVPNPKYGPDGGY